MGFSPELAEIRFGCGLSPAVAPPESVEAMLEALSGPDEMAARFAIPGFDALDDWEAEQRALLARMRKAEGTARFEALDARRMDLIRGKRREHAAWAGRLLLRATHARDGFRERLAAFWTDHFTVVGRTAIYRLGLPSYTESAIRPHLTGRFADLLVAAVTNPLMLIYLDQAASVGPNSRRARSGAAGAGLNENLAREVLELHTLGVDGPYTQRDVRELAELFTGLSLKAGEGFLFRPNLAEPGSETVLGRTYGGDEADFAPVRAVLEDLATHPATARHIARKLAVHFVADAPDPGLVAHLEARFRESGGALAEVYAALLEHPSAWDETLRNVKPPMDFMVSAARALAIRPERVAALSLRDMRLTLFAPAHLMGQEWERPPGPDGWPEEDAAWLTPQGLAARMRWAMAGPQVLRPDLPDPRAFVDHALGSRATEAVRFAARAAESRAEAIGLILTAPAFQRR